MIKLQTNAPILTDSVVSFTQLPELKSENLNKMHFHPPYA